jgi:2-polyprenyl-3-methyl-5-hydroxy-6-metoxy-1,4-benzoquinol methylase
MTSKKQTCVICGKRQNLIFSYRNFHYYRCQNCQLVSTYPLVTALGTEQHYAEKYKKGNYQLLRKYAPQYSASVYTQFVKILEQKLKEKNETLANKKVLDIGCFTGDFLKLLKQKKADVYGVELQKEAVQIANKKFPGKIYQADVTSFKFPQKKYDIVTLLGLIEHVPDPLPLIKRSYQLLNKNGILMIQTPNSASFLAKTMQKYWPPYTPIEHVHLFSRDGLENTLKKNGFEDISFKPHWKKLPIGYVYNMFNNFGPEFYHLFKPMNHVLSKSNKVMPFYIGEMIITASKK